MTDALRVTFFTNATAYEDWPSGGLLGNGTGVKSNATCCRDSIHCVTLCVCYCVFMHLVVCIGV